MPKFTLLSKLLSNTSNRKEWQGEAWGKKKNGSQYMASLDVFPVYDNTQQFQHYVGLFSDITQQKEHQKSLKHMAYHDPLTQLPNRALFSDRLQQAMARAARTKECVAICYFDLGNSSQLATTSDTEPAINCLSYWLSACVKTCAKQIPLRV